MSSADTSSVLLCCADASAGIASRPIVVEKSSRFMRIAVGGFVSAVRRRQAADGNPTELHYCTIMSRIRLALAGRHPSAKRSIGQRLFVLGFADGFARPHQLPEQPSFQQERAGHIESGVPLGPADVAQAFAPVRIGTEEILRTEGANDAHAVEQPEQA